jgi:hypothetical protein
MILDEHVIVEASDDFLTTSNLFCRCHTSRKLLAVLMTISARKTAMSDGMASEKRWGIVPQGHFCSIRIYALGG